MTYLLPTLMAIFGTILGAVMVVLPFVAIILGLSESGAWKSLVGGGLLSESVYGFF